MAPRSIVGIGPLPIPTKDDVLTVCAEDFVNGNIENVIEQCEHYLAQHHTAAVVTTCKKALKIQPEYTQMMDLLAQAYIEEGIPKLAFEQLQKSCKLQPENNPMKWMLLAQLQNGRDAVSSLQNGIKLFMKQLDRTSEQEIADVTIEICRGYCSIAEIFMTELCDEPEAESVCSSVLSQAVQLCPNNPEALYTLANLRFIQERHDEAEMLAEKCFNAVIAIENELEIPDYELRLNLAKLLLELSKNEQSILILERLLDEDDRYAEVVHLLAVAYAQVHDYVAALSLCEREAIILQALPKKETIEIRKAHKQLESHCKQSIEAGKQVNSNFEKVDVMDNVMDNDL